MKTILCYHYTMEVGLSLGIRGRHNTTGRLLAVNEVLTMAVYTDQVCIMDYRHIGRRDF